jgi:hypothetical protein
MYWIVGAAKVGITDKNKKQKVEKIVLKTVRIKQ